VNEFIAFGGRQYWPFVPSVLRLGLTK